MIQFDETQARTLLDKVLKLTKADGCGAVLQGGTTGNIRAPLKTFRTQRPAVSLSPSPRSRPA